MELANEHFRLLVESVQDYAIYLLDIDGTIRSWNLGAQRLKGYRADEIVGRTFAEFFGPEDREARKPQKLLADALRYGRIEDVGWRIRKDGTQFWASAIITTLRDASGAHVGFAKVTRDLTDTSYRAFVEASASIVWTTDPAGRPNADSPSWRGFTGQSEAEWRSPDAWSRVHPDDVPAVRAAWASAIEAHGRLEIEFRLRRSDGDYIWMTARAIPLLDGDRNIREWFGVTVDITARKQAELATERALRLWTTTLRSIGDAVIATDVHGRVRFINPVAERLTGWSSADAETRPLAEVFPIFNEETLAPVDNPVDKVLREGVVVGLANHTVLRQKSGALVPIDDSAAPITDTDGSIQGVVLVFRDASEDKREGLRRAFLATATEALFDAADHRDALGRVAQLAVPRLADWVGVDIVDANGGSLQRLAIAHVDPAKIEFARALVDRYQPDAQATSGVAQVIRTGRSELYPEISRELIQRVARDPEHLQILEQLELRSAMCVPLRGKRAVFGAMTFVFTGDRRYSERDLAFAEDLARRAGLIIERRRLEEEAEHANRMKDEFLATMSHELRTPLQAILGYAMMLERGAARDPQKAIAAIVRNAEAQSRLVEDILDVSRITSGKLQLAITRVDLRAAIRAAIESVRHAANARKIHLAESLPSDLGDVLGDFDRLQQIVWNLVSNAVKFSEPNGLVEIRAQRTGSSVQISVRDSGKGIAPEHLSSIFERFRQVDSSMTRQRGGLGLGLAIARHLVEAHGGTVGAASPGLGKGSTFTVTLPIVGDLVTAETATRARAHDAIGPLSGVDVLVVDDDEDGRDLLGQLLQEVGAHVRTAGSAAEAFAQVETSPPQVLISDIGMPTEDGYSFLRRVRALPPERGGDIPAIALTAYARSDDVRAALDAGFQLHVTKPVRAGDLIEAIRACARPLPRNM